MKMKFKNPLIVVTDISKSVDFYKNVLGLRVIADFGANKTLTGGVCLQTCDTLKHFINAEEISFGGSDAELYFEEDDFDTFAERLKTCTVEYVHPVKEHSWGQRVVRFYDPDRHIIEVGENIETVCRRFLDRGLTPEETAVRMDVPLEFVTSCMR
jgi:catechol 2,3-dioxygenase-like lactoylglutathione lyase family enzyme